MNNFQGWVDAPDEVAAVVSTLEFPNFQTGAPTNEDAMLHTIFKQQVGYWTTDVQEIGDCVSFGYGRMVDYTQVMDFVFDTSPGLDLDFEQTATEVIYAGGRVEIGGRRIGGDGLVGAWAARYIKEFGSISRKHLGRLGLTPEYSGQRARNWGQNGSPSVVKPEVMKHPIQDVTMVTTFAQAMWHLQSGRTIAVCSNVGFENNHQGQTIRDSKGFAQRGGSWAHCMTFIAGQMGSRPGLLCANQWPHSMVTGPMGDTELPPCSWWVDADTVNLMLGQRDSFTCSQYRGYPVRKLDWSH